MSTSMGISPTPRAVRAARLLGYLVFLTAFFLPACRQPASGAVGSSEAYKGYFCAWITIINTLNKEMWQTKAALAILSGWINPLLLLYVASLFSRKLRIFRGVVAAVILVFIVLTWIYFRLAPLVPLIGHVMWVAGILLILSSEFVRPGRGETKRNETEAR